MNLYLFICLTIHVIYRYFDHIFTIFGRERGLTFMCGSAEHKKKLIKLLDSKIEDFRGTKEKKKKSILFTELQNKSVKN